MKDHVLCQREIIATKWKYIESDVFFYRPTGSISTKLGTEHPWVMKIKFCFFFQMKDLVLFLRGDNNIRLNIYWQLFKNLRQNRWANFNQTWHKVFLGKGNSNLLHLRAKHFSRGHNSNIGKIHWRLLRIFYSIITWPISTKLDTEYPCVKWTQICWNERSYLPPRGIIAKQGNKTVPSFKKFNF